MDDSARRHVQKQKMRRTSWGERPSRQIGPANGSTYFWAACPGQALNLDVIQRCRHILLSHDELNGHQEALVDVKSSISKSGWGEWNQQSLIRKGFTVLNQPTIVAVAVPDGRRAVQFVFCPGCPISVHWRIFLIIYSTTTASGKPERHVAKPLSNDEVISICRAA